MSEIVAGRISHVTVRGKRYRVRQTEEDGWLVLRVPELPGCHTQAKDAEQGAERIRDAIETYLGGEDQ